MADPMTNAAIMSTLLKTIVPLFMGRDRTVDVDAESKKLFEEFLTRLDPSINAQARAAQVTGTGIAQNIGGSMGRAGTGLRTGQGVTARAIGRTVGNTRAITARGQGTAQAAILANQALPGVVEAKRKNKLTNTRFEELIAGLGQLEATTGQDPIQKILEMLGFDTAEEAKANAKNKQERGSAQQFMNTLGGGPGGTTPVIQRPTQGGLPGGRGTLGY